ncbi:hypothetical protein hamaS1_27790 [Moorella sp. Hama-1]|nr:hypothetical protein hamaS1_27790 [Moorella sp. Hama-1]
MKPPLTARKLLESGLVGMRKDRKDIGDSKVYARHLREQAQNRSKRGAGRNGGWQRFGLSAIDGYATINIAVKTQ